MVTFWDEYWPEIILSLITAGALGFCRYAYKQIQNYKGLLEQQDQKEITTLIQTELKPVNDRIEEVADNLEELTQLHAKQAAAIVTSYRFRLIQLCKMYFEQEYMTTAQFEQLSEMFKVYSELGGNGQAKKYYDRVIELPIRDD